MTTTSLQASCTSRVAVRPDDLFRLITDIDRLPEWNARIDHVVRRPDALVDGCEWVVEIRALGAKWDSRTELRHYDPDSLRFAYVSRTDDGNPSRAMWTWQLVPVDGGTDVTVDWELRPRTFWRRTLLARIRHAQLKREVQASISAAAALVLADQAPPPDRAGYR